MTLIQSLWLASGVGALLFFLGGFFLARRSPAAAPAAPPPTLYDPGGPVQREFAARLAAFQRTQLEKNKDLERALEQKLTEVQQEKERLRERAAEAQAAAQQVDPEVKIKLHRLEVKLEKVTAERDEAATKLEKALDALAVTDKNTVRRLEHEQASLQRKRERLERAISDLDMARKELRSVRTKLLNTERARQEVVAQNIMLRRRIQEATGKAFGNEDQLIEDLVQAVIQEGKQGGRETGLTRDMSLQSMLRHITTVAAQSTVTVADPQGLAIVSSGDHAEELAAAAALVSDTATRIVELLPFGEGISRIKLSAANMQEAEVYPFHSSHGPLLMATLAGPSGLDKGLVLKAMEKVILLLDSGAAR